MPTMTITYPLLYAAYGANTHREHMKLRCPTAKYMGNVTLHDVVLRFRGVADVAEKAGGACACALWEIERPDELALDRFEGYPNGYVKRYATLMIGGEKRLVMFYVMNNRDPRAKGRARTDEHEPPLAYERCLREGYEQCGISPKQINRAIKHARKSDARQKVYQGRWLSSHPDHDTTQLDKAAKPKSKSFDSGLEPRKHRGDLIDQASLSDLADGFEEYPEWMRRNFRLRDIEGL